MDSRQLGLVDNSEGLRGSSEGLDLDKVLLTELAALAEPVSHTKKASRDLMEQTIIKLCARAELSLEQLAQLLNRSVPVIRQDYLRALVKEKKLFYRFPTNPSHPRQAYTTVNKENE